MPHLLLKDLPRYECLLEASKEFPDLDPSALEAFLHLLRTGDDVFAVTEHSLTTHGISHGRFGVMMLLWQDCPPREIAAAGIDDCEYGSRTPAELAEAAGVTRATMTGLIDTLERDGYVKRKPDPQNRRILPVRLTSKGEEFLEEFMPGHFKTIAGLMSPLSEAERKTLVRLLGKIQQQATLSKIQTQYTASAIS